MFYKYIKILAVILLIEICIAAIVLGLCRSQKQNIDIIDVKLAYDSGLVIPGGIHHEVYDGFKRDLVSMDSQNIPTRDTNPVEMYLILAVGSLVGLVILISADIQDIRRKG